MYGMFELESLEETDCLAPYLTVATHTTACRFAEYSTDALHALTADINYIDAQFGLQGYCNELIYRFIWLIHRTIIDKMIAIGVCGLI